MEDQQPEKLALFFLLLMIHNLLSTYSVVCYKSTFLASVVFCFQMFFMGN